MLVVLILVITMHLRADWCFSLKDKRSEIKRLMHLLRNKFHVSVAESGQQDTWNLLQITLAALVFDQAQGDSMGESFYDFVLGNTEAGIVLWEAEYR